MDKLLQRSREAGYPLGRPALLRLVQRGFVDHAKRPGMGKGKGRAGLWLPTALRQVSAYCKLRKAGLRGKRLAFAIWWETGEMSPGVRDFMRYTLQAFSDLMAGEVYGKHPPRNTHSAKDAVRRYISRKSVLPSPDIFGPGTANVELAFLLSMLGLLDAKESPLQTLQKLNLPMSKVSSLPPPQPDSLRNLAPVRGERNTLPGVLQSINSLFTDAIGPYLSTLGLIIYALSQHATLPMLHLAIDTESAEGLMETRMNVRQRLANPLRQFEFRQYWRRLRNFLLNWSKKVDTLKKPRSFARFRDLLTREGCLALCVIGLLRAHQVMEQSSVADGL